MWFIRALLRHEFHATGVLFRVRIIDFYSVDARDAVQRKKNKVRNRKTGKNLAKIIIIMKLENLPNKKIAQNEGSLLKAK